MDPSLRQRLSDLLRTLADDLESGDADRIRETCERLCEVVSSDVLSEDTRWVVCAQNLAFDCLRRTLPRDTAGPCLRIVADDLTGEGLAPYVMRGRAIELDPGRPGLLASTVLQWEKFAQHYAAAFAYTRFGDEQLQSFWDDLESGEILGATQDVYLSGARGTCWITDHEPLRTVAQGGGGDADANRAYDHLGLDWSESWERYDGDPGSAERTGSSRAVLLTAPVISRARAESGLRTPTAVDAWGHFLFVPGDDDGAARWPRVGSQTVLPETGEVGLPEAVHGPVEISRQEVEVGVLGTVSKSGNGDRVLECGRPVLARASARLRRLLQG